MAQIPTAQSLGLPDVPASPRPIIGYDAGIAQKAAITADQMSAQGGEAAGAGLATAGDRIQAGNDAVAVAAGGSQVLQAKLALDKELEANQGNPNTPWANPGDWAQTYADRMAAVKDTALSGISNPTMKAQASVNFDNTIANAVSNVQQRAFVRGQSERTASGMANLNGLTQVGAQSDDEGTRAQTRQTAMDLIDGLVQGGNITPLQGEEQKKAWTATALAGRAQWLDAQGHPDQALAFVNQHASEFMPHQLDELYTHLRGRNETAMAIGALNRAQGGASPATAPSASAAPGGQSIIPAGWTPGDYPNAPATTDQEISNPDRNNPGNLRVSDANPWKGKTTAPGAAFESFDSMDNGIRARAMTYGTYLRTGTNTIDAIANKSGPASDGNDIPSQVQAYKTAMGGRYAAPGGENLPIDMTPENIRRLTAGGISIEAGGQGKWLPKGAGMPAIDRALTGMSQEPPVPSGGGATLASYATGNAVPGGPSSVEGVNPEFASRISTMVAAMPDDIRQKFQIISGFRDQNRQAEVNPSVTNSHHTQGMAVDTNTDPAVLSWVAQNGPKFGVGYPLASDPKEANHLEPLENGQRVSPEQMSQWVAQHQGGGDTVTGGAQPPQGGQLVGAPVSDNPPTTTPPVSPAPGMADLANAEAELARNHANTIMRLNSDPELANNPNAHIKALALEDRNNREKQVALTASRMALTEGRNAAADGYVQQMMKGPLDPQIIQQIADDPKLDATTRENLWRVYAAHTKNTADGDTAKYGPAFFDNFQKIHLPDDDPNKIRDPSQLYALATPKADGSQDLTLAGVDKLTAELKSGAKPETTAESAVRLATIEYAKKQMVLEYPDFSSMKDSKGEASFNIGFVPQFYKYWDDGIKAGKTPQQLADRKAIDDMITPLLRNPAELLRDQLNAADAARSAPQQGPPAPVVVTPTSPAALYLRANPDSRGDFDKRYGAGSADRILGATPPPAAEPTAPMAQP
jgi:hypothetical protein